MTAPRRSLGERLAHGAARLERHAMAIGIALLVVVGAITYVSVIAINGVPFTDPYRVSVELPDDAPLLKDGDDVRIAGQRAGAVRGIDVGRDGRAVARLAIDRDRAPVGRDAHATVRLRGLAGAVYVSLDPGDRSLALTEGATLPRDQASGGVQLTDVLDTFDAPTRERMTRSLSAYGRGLIGGGKHVNQALRDLPPLLPQLTTQARAASPAEGDLAGVLGGLRETAAGFATPGGRDLARLLPIAADAFDVLADRGEAVQDTLAAVPRLAATADRVLPVADATLDQAAAVAARLTPAIAALDDSLPALLSLTRSRSGLRSLRTLAREATPVVDAARPLLAQLQRPAGTLAPLADVLQPFATHLGRYGVDIEGAARGFTTWGDFNYPFGEAAGSRAVRFAPVFTCARGRNPYPAPGQGVNDREPCRG